VSDYRNTAGDRSFARDIGVEPRTRPIASPQSTGMAEAFRSDGGKPFSLRSGRILLKRLI